MKRIDLSNYAYVGIMILAFWIGSCVSKQRVIPAPKYTPSYYNGLEISKYQSSIDTSMNYLEDVIDAFPERNEQ